MTTSNITNPKIKKSFTIIGVISLLLLSIIAALGLSLFTYYSNWSDLEIERSEYRVKVEELRQSSDNLTRFIRLYALTGKKEYIDNYFQIIKIRDGSAPRPQHYHNVYWDLPPETREVRHPPSTKEALIEKLKSLRTSENNKKLLATSFNNSEGLATIERSVYKTLDDVNSDEVARETAIQSLFSSKYQQAKVDIMRPINTVLSNLAQEHELDSRKLQSSIKDIILALKGASIAFLLIFLGAIVFTVRNVLRPMKHLVDSIHSIKDGDELKEKVYYHDEIGAVTRQVYSMQKQLSNEVVDDGSTTDSLTSLGNRSFFYKAVNDVSAAAQKTGKKYTVIVCDADNLKSINDAHGVEVGDMAVTHIANIIKSNLQPHDICSRIGGGRFMALLVDCDAGAGKSICDKILLGLKSTPFRHNEHQITASISAGASDAKTLSMSSKKVIDDAEIAMHKAKGQGQGFVVVN
ncbi:MAG: GGDEF domain-containing protein [Gammaproteobacteria bacterium WSBS_2016_MAG_OTU1]